jgi:hypothetical protein
LKRRLARFARLLNATSRFLKELSPLIRSGDIRKREYISEGLEAAT